MNYRLLVATALLLSTLSCSKKETAAPIGTCSYKLNGQLVTCPATAYVSSLSSGNQTYTTLQITLVNAPQAQSDTKKLSLTFKKLPTEPSTAYQLYFTSYYSPQVLSQELTPSVTTLRETSTGVFSGTFSGTITGPIQTVITDGVFTDARL